MSGQSSGQKPQTSISSGTFSPSALRAETSPAANGDQARKTSLSSRHFHKETSSLAAQITAPVNLLNEPLRKQKLRNTGGFLLPTESEAALQHERSSTSSPQVQRDLKGKQKAEKDNLVIPKRASARQSHRQKPSLGSSPLAVEILHTQPVGNEESNEVADHVTQWTPKKTLSSSLYSNSPSTEGTSLNSDTSKTSAQNLNHYEIDPAQIVNLALTLSESRRRHASAGELLAPRGSVGGRRLVSLSHDSAGLPHSSTGRSLRQHLQQQRYVSGRVSPRSIQTASSKGTRSSILQKDNTRPGHLPPSPNIEADLIDGAVFDASEATFARAEKAKATLELFYEYRRLLQYLPKLPAPSDSRPATSKIILKSQKSPNEALGRFYNPLQYIRNRTVRLRERRPLEAEADGWKDVDNVRAWVDLVANEREDGLSRVDRRFPLPSFENPKASRSSADDIEDVDGSYLASLQAKKPARPRLDGRWKFTPWDLLADAYWLHQDDNFKHIENSQGQKVVKITDVDEAEGPRRSKESFRKPRIIGHPEALFRPNNSSPEKIRSSFESFRSVSKERGRRRKKVPEPRSPISDDNGSQTRRARWPKKLIRSDSRSSSRETGQDGLYPDKSGRSRWGSHDHPETAALEQQMMDRLAKEKGEIPADSGPASKDVLRWEQSSLDKIPSSLANGLANGPYLRRPSGPQRIKTDMPVSQKQEVSGRTSLDEERLYHSRMSSEDFSSTAPNSPTTPSFVPSIAINLSPAESNFISPQFSKKGFPSQIGSFRRNRSRSLNKRAVNETTSSDISRQTTNSSDLHNKLNKKSMIDPASGFLSPNKSESAGNRSRIMEGKIKSIKDSNSPDSKVRGFFKGGRIAELVGNEVSRVGDILWKRENGSTISPINSSVVNYGSEESEIDDGETDFESNPEDSVSRITSNTDGIGNLSRTATNDESPKYFMSNLPSFRPQSTRQDQSPKSSKASLEHDHITRQQLALRERGRSSRFDRLAPPRMDLRGISPSSSLSPSPDRQRIRADREGDSHHSSSSRSGRRVRSADRRLNALLSIPGDVWRGGPAPTGLSALDPQAPGSAELPSPMGQKQWDIPDRNIPAERATIMKRDIARIRALLLSSGVKANEIARRAEEIPENPSLVLKDLHDLFEGSLPQVPRSQEHQIAARFLVSSIETNVQRLRNTAEVFSHTTVKDLNHQIKAIDKRIDEKLTPLVRTSADDADAFNIELTTTHTLAVKQLNDNVDAILRRRRRRFRYLRRGGWAALEWTLLGTMWMVWFVVVVIRMIRSFVGCLVGVLRWFFWL